MTVDRAPNHVFSGLPRRTKVKTKGSWVKSLVGVSLKDLALGPE